MSDESPPPLSSVFDAVQLQMSRLVTQRDALLRQLQEIEEKVAAVAGVLGIDPSTLAATTTVPESRVDGRRAGSMVEYMVNAIRNSENGLTRVELKRLLRETEEYGERVTKSENGFYNAVMRLVRRRELEEAGGRLYVAGLAPAGTATKPNGSVNGLFDDTGGINVTDLT